MKSDHDGSNGTADGRTRDRVVAVLLAGGAATAVELSRQLGVSPAGIRRHLDAMVADGTLTAAEARSRGPRGRGRPARRYALTAAGHQAGPTTYSDLAADALGFLAEVGGPAAVARFADSRATELERRVRSAVATADPADRPAALAAAMTDAGYTASVSEVPTGVQICQHHCPVQFVAERFPALCDAETAALARVLDTHVQRLATIAHGDGVCTTHIPAGPVTGAGAHGTASRPRPGPVPPDRDTSGRGPSDHAGADAVGAGPDAADPVYTTCQPSTSSEGSAI